MKKTDKQEFERLLKSLSNEERMEALQWIDSLSEDELKAFENSDRVKLAEALLEAYLKSKKKD